MKFQKDGTGEAGTDYRLLIQTFLSLGFNQAKTHAKAPRRKGKEEKTIVYSLWLICPDNLLPFSSPGGATPGLGVFA